MAESTKTEIIVSEKDAESPPVRELAGTDSAMPTNGLEPAEDNTDDNCQSEKELSEISKSDDDEVVATAEKATSTTTKVIDNEEQLDEESIDGFWARQFKRMASKAWLHLGIALLVSIILSALALTVGDFEVAVDNAGWQSRGTLISDRQTQLMLTDAYQDYLFYGGPEAWDDLLNNVQEGWESESLGDSASNSRRLLSGSENTRRALPFHIDSRLLQNVEGLEGCDTDWYTNWTALEEDTHLWPIWKPENGKDSIMDPGLLKDLCKAEANTQSILEAKGLCFGCQDGCLPPYSIVLYARLVVPDGFSLTCKELSEAWTDFQEETEEDWAKCVADLKVAYNPKGFYDIPESCPVGFSPTLVQEDFDQSRKLEYTSSIFATTEDDIDEMYDAVDSFDQGSSKIYGAYDTQDEDFNVFFTDAAVGRDMTLACGSAVITTLAMLVHTKSPFITCIGLLQIVLSFPLGFFVYTFAGGLDFFPFLNFIGIFVVFALGADNVFVATDKWKNARLAHPSASNLAIAALALPDAAGAMFLTTITTAIAFFGTAICPVAPIKLFAIFCGLLIMFDYILCVLLVFPALCIYDRKLITGTANWCVACHFCRRFEGASDEEPDEDHEEEQSLIRRILLKFYHILHKLRWPLLALCAAGFAVCILFSLTLELPRSADVRILDEDNQFEQNYVWRSNLLYDVLAKSGGSVVSVGFGLLPADTGDLNDPSEWSQLVLDNGFDPESEEAQLYLDSFCAALLREDFADLPSEGYECPFDMFSSWIEEQGNATTPVDAYSQNCGGAKSIPIPSENFHDCIIAWSELEDETRVLSNNGKVKILWFTFGSRVRWDSPFDDLDDEWNRIEKWFDRMAATAPVGLKKAFFSSEDFWWYDTNGQMLTTAYGAAGIALGAAALVILFSSRSFTLTFFAVLTIGYVLTAVTATLVGFGWTLGFLESICFAILIGVSVDFVIHFTHSYSHYKGKHSRSERTKHALIQMGPSILAAAFTTIAAAVTMLFTIITFFQKFALILLMTILQATIGSFIVFLVMADTMGPTEPTALVDKLVSKCQRKNDDEEITKKNEATEATAKMRDADPVATTQ